MSIYLPGVTFPSQRVTPSDDGAVFAACVSDGLYGSTITTSGTSLRLTVGKIVACGRVIRIASQTDIAMTQTSGNARLVLTIDKSKSAAQQVALDVQYGSDTLTSLTQQDINGSGTKYQVALCMASLSSSSTTILWTCGPAHGKGKGITVQLPAGAANWTNNQHTAYVSGVTANSNVICTYTPGQRSAYQVADIDCIAQADGALTFSCSTVPTAAINVSVLLL